MSNGRQKYGKRDAERAEQARKFEGAKNAPPKMHCFCALSGIAPVGRQLPPAHGQARLKKLLGISTKFAVVISKLSQNS